MSVSLLYWCLWNRFILSDFGNENNFVVEGIKFEYDELRCCVSNDEEM